MDTGVEAAAMGGGRDDASRDLDGAELRQPSTFGQLLWRLQVQTRPLPPVVLWVAMTGSAGQRCLCDCYTHRGYFPIPKVQWS